MWLLLLSHVTVDLNREFDALLAQGGAASQGVDVPQFPILPMEMKDAINPLSELTLKCLALFTHGASVGLLVCVIGDLYRPPCRTAVASHDAFHRRLQVVGSLGSVPRSR